MPHTDQQQNQTTPTGGRDLGQITLEGGFKPLIEKLAAIAGRSDIEITIRAERSFTVSFDGIDRAAASRIAAFFVLDNRVSLDIAEDREAGTFIYIDIKE